MTAPRFGRCGDCAAWRRFLAEDDPRDRGGGVCARHPRREETSWSHGCFDWLPITSKEDTDHG